MLKIKKLDNTGIAHLLIPILAICLIAAAGSYFVFKSSASVDGTTDINNVSLELGKEELIADPSSMDAVSRYESGPETIADNSYFVEKEKGTYYGYLANVNSYAFKLDDNGVPMIPTDPSAIKPHLLLSSDNRPKTPQSAVDRFNREEAQGKHPDSCGAWLLSTIQADPSNKKHWIAWYHGEDRCNYSNGGQTHMTLAFAESFDEGKNWQKGSGSYTYPNNRVITADTALQGNTKTDDTGGGRTIREGDYYYMFYRSSGQIKQTAADGTVTMISTDDNLHVARSKVSDLGKPGTWKKWYCRDSGIRATCDYTEPGIGGKSTPISVSAGAKPKADMLPSAARFVNYNRYLKRYITIQANGDGFTLRASNGDDFLTWKAKKETIYPAVTQADDYTVQNWNYRKNSTSKQCQMKKDDGTYEVTNFECKQLYMYTSAIGMQGDGERTGRQFYLYYAKVYPGEEHNQRYLFRRKVTLHARKAPPAQDKTTRVELTLYEDNKGHKRITTESPEPRLGYTAKSVIGYVLSDPAEDYVPMFECKKANGEYYTMKLPEGSKPYDVPVPTTAPVPPTKCNTTSTDKLVRRIGWVSPTRTTEASVAILNNDANAKGAAKLAPLGYALPSLETK